MSSELKRHDTDVVIIRAYGDEPVPLKAISTQNGIVEVAGEDESKSLGFTADVVYPFDDSLFGKLRRAYEARDHNTLVQLWQEARSYKALALA